MFNYSRVFVTQVKRTYIETQEKRIDLYLNIILTIIIQ